MTGSTKKSRIFKLEESITLVNNERQEYYFHFTSATYNCEVTYKTPASSSLQMNDFVENIAMYNAYTQLKYFLKCC